LLRTVYEKFGIETTFVDLTDLSELRHTESSQN
jgi:hypothetical protein